MCYACLRFRRLPVPIAGQGNVTRLAEAEHDICNRLEPTVGILERHRAGVLIEDSYRVDSITIPVAGNRPRAKAAEDERLDINRALKAVAENESGNAAAE